MALGIFPSVPENAKRFGPHNTFFYLGGGIYTKLSNRTDVSPKKRAHFPAEEEEGGKKKRRDRMAVGCESCQSGKNLLVARSDGRLVGLEEAGKKVFSFHLKFTSFSPRKEEKEEEEMV